MKNVLYIDEIRQAEKESGARLGGELFLRLNAALAVANCIAPRALENKAKTAVFCGTGGNGYDGMLAACRLKKLGCDVTVYLVGDIRAVDEALHKYTIGNGVKILPMTEYVGGATIIVDAIFGIGLNRNIDGDVAQLIKMLNGDDKAFKFAIDVPSGLNADSGEIMGVCFRADVTITFSCYKPGMLSSVGRDVCGEITVKDVGVQVSSDMFVYEDDDFKKYNRARSAHKGSVGKVFVIGGCGTMIGAPILAGSAAHAAYLNGAGTVTVCLPSVHRAAASARAVMAMMMFLPDTPDGFIKFDKSALDKITEKATAIDIGIGMGNTPDLKRIVEYLCDTFCGVLVIDADALNAIKLDYAFLKSAKPKIVVTPHVGEFERLTGKLATIENAVDLAKEINGIVVLKSATTIITDGKTVRVNLKGTPAMAKGGMGDVLGGCITALSCAFDTYDAATIACYRNGIGAERAVCSYSQMMLTAKDVLKFADYEEI